MYHIEKNNFTTIFIEGVKSTIVAEEMRKKTVIRVVEDRTTDWQNHYFININPNEVVSRYNLKRNIFVVTNTSLEKIVRIMFRTNSTINEIFNLINTTTASSCKVSIYPGNLEYFYEYYPDDPDDPDREIILPNFTQFANVLSGTLRRGLLYYYPSSV